MIPWLFVLATQLPAATRAWHWSAAWVGLDSLEALGLAGTGLLLARRDDRYRLVAMATGTLLLTDAWFDVMTAAPGRDQLIAILMAACPELPVAALCMVLALRKRTAPAGQARCSQAGRASRAGRASPGGGQQGHNLTPAVHAATAAAAGTFAPSPRGPICLCPGHGGSGAAAQ
jgi:hypothetical protein